MTRPHRIDAPGTMHHLFNRGLARRTVFENEADVRFALAQFAREVRRGRLRLISYSFLTTHFHALVVSPTGELSDAMQQVMNVYVRRFNRLRKRDGPLFRARFGSRVVDSDTYRVTLIRYIDQNAPKARIANADLLYPFGSAAHHMSGRRPRWLDGAWIDELLGPVTPETRIQRYAAWFDSTLTQAEVDLVQERMNGAPQGLDELDDLVRAAPAEVRDWMLRKALLADGTPPGVASAGRGCVAQQIEILASRRGAWELRKGEGHQHSVWPVLLAALLRELACLSFAEIGGVMAIEDRQAARLYSLHRVWVRDIPEYAESAAAVVKACVATLPRPLSGVESAHSGGGMTRSAN